MHDRAIAKLALVMAVVGIAGLFAVNLLLVPTALAVGEIDESRLGQIVSLDATIKTAAVNDGNVFLTLEDGGGEIKAVIWQSVARGTSVYDLRAGDEISATGQITSYRGELEIVVSKLVLLP